jgi:glycosyltransferase involved in cell wall biosynthesis
LSGGDRHLLEMAARWQETVEICVSGPRNAETVIRSFVGDAPLAYVGGGNSSGPVDGARLASLYLKRAVAAERRPPRADVVIAASHFLPDAATVHAAVRHGAHGVAYVYHLVAGRTDRSPRTLWSKADERLSLALLRRSAGTVFTSNAETAAVLRNDGFDPIHTDVGIDLQSFRRARPAGAAPIALFVARLAPRKGLRDIISVWPRILERVPAARLLVVGSGPDREPTEAAAHAAGLADSIEWLGFISEEKKRDLLANARVFVAPSYEEGWGISVAEALASALPVVAYRLPTLDELFGGAYDAVEPGDLDGLADALIRNLTDDDLVARLSELALACVARFDLAAIATAELDTILDRAARSRKPSHRHRRGPRLS